ncbi:MAG: glycoside hydrolase family 1 protein [Candidatus Sungbacteria bacterium]|uniref:Glycoside hydrolase family 1 protein n=1 Tax=Candidatus Sungiibacteriota bacterium TaxID=2750080 RepID=A0A931SDQ9_9BACT|nr:glycoside hydrolase family 1 protein [Candidatus Sungbacteria bacterium]
MGQKFQFPKGFLWGAATSAHQVEGGNHNDWTEWEKSPKRIAELKTRGLNPDDYISGKACDHYNRFREDFDIAKSLGHNAHRFSIEWSRIEPEEGKFDEKEIEHYRQVLLALKERGLEPVVTLYHYTLPLWFVRKGGWLNSHAPMMFLNYVSKLADEYGSIVKIWVTQNEPETVARESYLIGWRPPHKTSFLSARRCLHILLEAHKLAYDVIKKVDLDSQIGIAETLVYFDLYKNTLLNKLTLKLIKWWRNNPLFSEFIKYSDFVGLEYYYHTRVRFNPFTSKWGIQFNENKKISDMGWELFPQGLLPILVEMKKFDKPVYILEHGLADAKDQNRSWYIKESLKFIAQAMQKGVDVRGYFHWSLLDNFEWQGGFGRRFGLVEINYKTFEREIRPSALEYKKIITLNSIEI